MIMHKHRPLLNLILSLMLVGSYVILSGHIASHTQSGSSVCTQCNAYFNTSGAVPPSVTAIDVAVTPDSVRQSPHAAQPVTALFYRTPARAPPLFS